MRLTQNSIEWIASFVAFKSKDDNFESIKMPAKSAKAIGIQALSSTKYLILDSEGNLHLLFLAASVQGSETPYYMKQLTHNMKVRKLVVFPDSSTSISPSLSIHNFVFILFILGEVMPC